VRHAQAIALDFAIVRRGTAQSIRTGNPAHVRPCLLRIGAQRRAES
jgi:hypothetical protein